MNLSAMNLSDIEQRWLAYVYGALEESIMHELEHGVSDCGLLELDDTSKDKLYAIIFDALEQLRFAAHPEEAAKINAVIADYPYHFTEKELSIAHMDEAYLQAEKAVDTFPVIDITPMREE